MNDMKGNDTTMRHGLLSLLLLLTACVPHREPAVSSAPGTPVPPSAVVSIDGRFDEWAGAERLLDDPADTPADAAVDFGTVHALDEPAWLHLAIDLGRPVNVQSMRGMVRLVLDTDGDSTTGGRLYDVEGADAVVELSRQDRPRASGYGAGVGIRAVTRAGEGKLEEAHEAGLHVAPTHMARRFELRLRRGAQLAGAARLQGEALRLQLVFVDAAGERDRTAVAIYRPRTPFAADQPPPAAPPIAKAAGAFRVVVWNVSGESLRDHPQPYARVLAALAPDVVLLDEVYREVSAETMAAFFAQPPLAALGSWQYAIGRSGGRQKNVVASRLPLRPEESLLQVAYPEAGLADLEEQARGEAHFKEMLVTERRDGVAMAGAWVTIEGQDLLFVNLDLQAAGYAGSFEDHLRILQAQVIHEQVSRVAQGKSPLVIAGDFNLVGSATPLDTLRADLDPGDAAGADLAVADAYRLGDRSQATWRSTDGGRFTPGRLDFILFTASRLTLDRAFVFNSAELSPAQLAALAAARGDSTVSDHLPVVADLRWR